MSVLRVLVSKTHNTSRLETKFNTLEYRQQMAIRFSEENKILSGW